MQKSWGWPSLFYDFGEVSINHFMIFIVAKCNGCVPSCSLKLYFSVTALSEAWSLHQTFCMLCGLMFTWLLKYKRTTIFFFFFFWSVTALSCSSQPHVVYLLMLPSHAFYWNAVIATWFHIFVQSLLALCQLSSAVFSIYKIHSG